METVSCNLCGSRESDLVYRMPDHLYFRDQWFSTVACRSCGLGFVNPRPTKEEIGAYYPAEFYEYFENPDENHDRRYGIEAEYVERALRSPGRLLDVGCANGGFPRFMKARGWDVEGVEVSQTSRPIDDFPVHKRVFPEVALAPAQYDVVTAWAVLEHTHDPMAYFRKAFDVLKPGGAFIFLVTNFESTTSRMLFCEDPPRHLYFFTESTVKQYLRTVGMVLEHADFDGRIYRLQPQNWLRYQLHRLGGKPFTWEDAQLNRQNYFRDHGLRPTLLNTARFCLRHPIAALDRALMPLYERFQVATRSYGIGTFVARKPVG